MPFLLAEILNFQGSTHRIGVGSFSNIEETDFTIGLRHKGLFCVSGAEQSFYLMERHREKREKPW